MLIATLTSDLLTELSLERHRFTKANQPRMLELINELVARNHYTETPQTIRREKANVENPFLEMVENYGVYWNVYEQPHNCSHCDTNLCDNKNGPPFKLEISLHGILHCYKCDTPIHNP